MAVGLGRCFIIGMDTWLSNGAQLLDVVERSSNSQEALLYVNCSLPIVHCPFSSSISVTKENTQSRP